MGCVYADITERDQVVVVEAPPPKRSR